MNIPTGLLCIVLIWYIVQAWQIYSIWKYYQNIVYHGVLSGRYEKLDIAPACASAPKTFQDVNQTPTNSYKVLQQIKGRTSVSVTRILRIILDQVTHLYVYSRAASCTAHWQALQRSQIFSDIGDSLLLLFL